MVSFAVPVDFVLSYLLPVSVEVNNEIYQLFPLQTTIRVCFHRKISTYKSCTTSFNVAFELAQSTVLQFILIGTEVRH